MRSSCESRRSRLIGATSRSGQLTCALMVAQSGQSASPGGEAPWQRSQAPEPAACTAVYFSSDPVRSSTETVTAASAAGELRAKLHHGLHHLHRVVHAIDDRCAGMGSIMLCPWFA